LKPSPCTEAIKKYRCEKAKEVSMKKGSFEELINMLKTQDALKKDGYQPIGWYQGQLLWGKNFPNASVTRILLDDDVDQGKVFPIDSINAVLV